MDKFYADLISNFDLKGKYVSCDLLDEGLINNTRVFIMEENGKPCEYILQKINHNVFKDIDKMMNNIMLVTEFNRKKIKERDGDPDRESLTLVCTRDGKPYHHCKETDEYYRVYKFIPGAIAYQVVHSPEQFYESAVAFGNFAKQLSEFDVSRIHDTIENFHNTKKRYDDFVKAVSEDVFGRAESVRREIDFLLARKDYSERIVNLLENGEMPTRITHNDTRLNNVMLDKETGKGVVVVDLDTIMKGSICYDFGDSIRGGCRHCDDDEKDLSKVNFDIELFEVFAKGYLSALGDCITQVEKDNLAFSSLLITYELSMRFLGDYLNGDVYFKTKYPTHNLDRARVHIKLLQDMEKALPEMEEIIRKY